MANDTVQQFPPKDTQHKKEAKKKQKRLQNTLKQENRKKNISSRRRPYHRISPICETQENPNRKTPDPSNKKAVQDHVGGG
jgi:hypothetical protein